MSPQPSPGPPVPPGKHPRKATSKPLAVPLGKVGVAIVDDDERMRVMVQDILDRDREFQLVGSYSSGEAALTGIPQSGAQIVLMDIRMPGMSGIECSRRLKALMPHLIIVMVTGLDDPRTMNLARECGADGFLAKPFTPGQFLGTLSFCVPRPKVKAAKIRPSGKGPRDRGIRGPSLTARENRLMEYMARGLPYKEIATLTSVSESAVHHMRSRIFKKLGVTNKVEAIREWKNNNNRRSS